MKKPQHVNQSKFYLYEKKIVKKYINIETAFVQQMLKNSV